MFWLTAALLTFAASLAVLLPFLRRQENLASDGGDLAVYRDQLAELERDATRGAIPPGEADAARAEIGRRILRAAEQGAEPRRVASSQATRLIAAAAVLGVPLVAWSVYAALGTPGLPAQPLAARLSSDPAESTMEELVARAERHLAAAPEDGRGWDVLAPIYVRLGRFEDAALAYRNALRLLGDAAERRAGLGEALAGAAGGTVTEAARAEFAAAVRLDPEEPRSHFYLALALAQEGRLAEAAEGWSAMLAELPPESPWRGPAEAAIAEARRQLAAGDPGQVQDGAETAAAEELAPEERAAMIEGMVAGLDEKLRASPRDPEGWHRLVRSYVVLGRSDAARDALSRGLEALGPETQEGRGLAAFAASLGLTATE